MSSLLREALIKSLAHICDVIFPKFIVETLWMRLGFASLLTRFTTSKAPFFALNLCKIPIADMYHFFNQHFLRETRKIILMPGFGRVYSTKLRLNISMPGFGRVYSTKLRLNSPIPGFGRVYSTKLRLNISMPGFIAQNCG